jgi:uncharacterized membrane protein
MTDRADEGAENDGSGGMPPHIEQTVQSIARLHADHHRSATALQRLADRLADLIAHPWFIAAVACGVVGWVVLNLVLWRLFGRGLDTRGFIVLQVTGQMLAITITTLVLMSQRRRDELAELRDQLTLELALLTEQKVAKLIDLQEEARRDNPLLANRVDAQAEAMSAPADPEAVLEAFRETHQFLLMEYDTEPSPQDPVSASPAP